MLCAYEIEGDCPEFWIAAYYVFLLLFALFSKTTSPFIDISQYYCGQRMKVESREKNVLIIEDIAKRLFERMKP